MLSDLPEVQQGCAEHTFLDAEFLCPAGPTFGSKRKKSKKMGTRYANNLTTHFSISHISVYIVVYQYIPLRVYSVLVLGTLRTAMDFVEKVSANFSVLRRKIHVQIKFSTFRSCSN